VIGFVDGMGGGAARLPQSLFRKMNEARVAAQGEFRSLNHWRLGYEAYLIRMGRFKPNVDMMFEHFEIVEDFGR
jgi:uncharacterized protein YhfF